MSAGRSGRQRADDEDSVPPSSTSVQGELPMAEARAHHRGEGQAIPSYKRHCVVWRC